jgi:hypothetical protein
MLLYLLYIEQPFCDTSYTFVLTNGTLEVHYTTNVIVTVPAGATTGTVIGTNNCGYIDEVDETFSIANGTVSATGTIIDNNAPTGNDASASKECVYLH